MKYSDNFLETLKGKAKGKEPQWKTWVAVVYFFKKT